ncbi:MAG: 50S ribosomal protein L32 [Planctomycetes bacterium]|nr:50S ribosomal protein L32 [Planctomycetota bacterium]
MPNPKRRHSKARKRLRRTHDALSAPTLMNCPRCKAAKRPHTVCDQCGYYGGQEVLTRDNQS